MWYWLLEAVVAFVASNVDELLVSVMQFAQAVRESKQIQEHDHISEAHTPPPTERTPLQPSDSGEALHVRHVILGQLVGFTLIILLSLAGYALGTLVERPWIGLLGLLPIALGVKELAGECRKLYRKPRAASKESEADGQPRQARRMNESTLVPPPPVSSSWSASCCSARTLQVASVAFASGSDSIGVYVPLFASSTIGQIVVLILLFYVAFFLWMWLAYKLVNFRIVASAIKEYGEFVGPVLLILLGVYILYDCDTVDLYYRYAQ